MTTATPPFTLDRLAEHFIAKITRYFPHRGHNRKVGPWLGFVLQGIERVVGLENMYIRTDRQLGIRAEGRLYKVRFSHTEGGHIQIVHMKADGVTDGPRIVAIHNLAEAERFYRTAGEVLLQQQAA
jgi:hypothetical protein